MSESLRCQHLADLVLALGFRCDRVRGGLRPEAMELRARVQTFNGILLSEEVHPRRLSVRWGDPTGRASVLVVLRGQGIVEVVEACGRLRLFQVAAGEALVLASSSQDLTLSAVPCRLLRVLLPPGSTVPPNRLWSADLSLVLPMLRLLEQAGLHLDAVRTRQELAQTLLAYLLDRLDGVGCPIQLAQVASGAGDPLQQLDQWMALRLTHPLKLSDLAAAVHRSPRRLQELCQLQHGCSPMERLRHLRLQALVQQLQDPERASQSLRDLMAALHLPDSAATRQAFQDQFGCPPSAIRRRRSGMRRQRSSLRSGQL